MELLSEQFNASVIGYDVAILSNDALLTDHIWQRFFKCQNDNPEQLEKLLFYVRKQVCYFIHFVSYIYIEPPAIRPSDMKYIDPKYKVENNLPSLAKKN